MRVPSTIAGEYYRLGTAVREKRMTVEQALKEIAQICVDRHEHFGLMLVPIVETSRTEVATMPLAPYMGLRTILNHVEPGWENCRAVVQQWFDALPLPFVEASRSAAERDSSKDGK